MIPSTGIICTALIYAPPKNERQIVRGIASISGGKPVTLLGGPRDNCFNVVHTSFRILLPKLLIEVLVAR